MYAHRHDLLHGYWAFDKCVRNHICCLKIIPNPYIPLKNLHFFHAAIDLKKREFIFSI
jgi:hypothetical protein